jgi:parvulin-like peptidyl-prolyl isomerase
MNAPLRSPRGHRLGLLAAAAALLLLPACGKDGGSDASWPEDEWTFAISLSVYQSPEGAAPSAAFARAREAMRQIESGTSFEEVARKTSDDKNTAPEGGFVGFTTLREESTLTGAIQVLKPGESRGPVLSNQAFFLLHRHSFDEARRIEQRYRAPLQGVVVSWADLPEGSPRSEAEAKKLAEEVQAGFAAGTLSMEKARERTSATGNPSGYIGMANRERTDDPVWNAVKDLPEGTWGPVVKGARGYVVARRIPYLRSIVRHIVVRYAGAQGRDLTVKRSREEAQARAEKALAAARAPGAKWSEVVREYTDEVPTIVVDGSVGAIGNGDLAPSIEQALVDTPPGEIHPKVVESPAGFHVLWRVN